MTTQPPKTRTVSAHRKTSETEIQATLNLDGQGNCKFPAEIPFFEHMLDHLCRHGALDLEGSLKGDLEIDSHHSVEDAGILLGSMLNEALAERRGINRYGHFTLPMDEVLVTVAVDFGGRYYFDYSGPDSIKEGKFGNYDAELTLEFLQKLALHARMNLHVRIHTGDNRHHLHEGIFKALGRALRMALARDERMGDAVPSTKGVL